jgi:hypothetical protein
MFRLTIAAALLLTCGVLADDATKPSNTNSDTKLDPFESLRKDMQSNFDRVREDFAMLLREARELRSKVRDLETRIDRLEGVRPNGSIISKKIESASSIDDLKRILADHDARIDQIQSGIDRLERTPRIPESRYEAQPPRTCSIVLTNRAWELMEVTINGTKYDVWPGQQTAIPVAPGSTNYYIVHGQRPYMNSWVAVPGLNKEITNQ